MKMFDTPTSVYVLLAALSVASAVLVGLVAVWAALGKRPHWAVRCGLLLGMISLGLLIPAHELVAMFFVQSLVVAAALAVYRMFQKHPDGTRGGFQFSLLDMLLFTALTAVVMAAACSTPLGTWTQGRAWFYAIYQWNATLDGPHEAVFYLSSGVLFGFATLIACWVVLSKRRFWIRLPVLAMFNAIACIAAVCLTIVTSGGYSPNSRIISLASFGLFIPAATVVVTSVWLFLARGSGQTRPGRWMCRLGWATLSLAVLLPTAGTLYFMATPPIPQTTLPDPNAYDTFVRVGKELVNITVPDLYTPGPNPKQTLAAFERKSDVLLAQAHEALQQECRVSAVYDETWLDSNFPDMIALRELARGFVAQGDAACMDGGDVKAAECYLAAARMGRATARGGIHTEALVSIACEGMGLYRLHELQGSLSDEQLLELAKTLRSMQNPAEPLEAITAREEISAYYISGWEGRLELMFAKLMGTDTFLMEVAENAFTRRLASYRILLIEIALTQYRNKHGGYPQKLDALVGEWLDELPQEPYGADGFVYRLIEPKPGVTGKPGYKLYSPGPNRQDDGGGPNATGCWNDDIGFFW